MKAVSRCGWVTRFGGVVLMSLLTLPSYAQLMLAHEGHHGGGGCTIETGDFPVTFSAYEVPEGDIPPMHSYCESIPKAGKVNLTIELTDRASREIPLAVRLIKDEHEGHSGRTDNDAVAGNKAEKGEGEHDVAEHEGHGDSAHGADEHGIVYMPAEKHNSGIIVVAANIEEKGQYTVLLEKQDDAGKVSTAVRIPLNVGSGSHGGHGGGISMMEITLLLVAAGGGAFYFLRRKQPDKTSKASDASSNKP